MSIDKHTPIRKGVEAMICRSCNAPIFWAVSVNGKSIPMNEEPVDNGNLAITCYDGNTPVVGRATDSEVERYTSHFATCADAPSWRKRSQPDATTAPHAPVRQQSPNGAK